LKNTFLRSHFNPLFKIYYAETFENFPPNFSTKKGPKIVSFGVFPISVFFFGGSSGGRLESCPHVLGVINLQLPVMPVQHHCPAMANAFRRTPPTCRAEKLKYSLDESLFAIGMIFELNPQLKAAPM